MQIELINEKYHTRKQIEGYQQVQAMYYIFVNFRLEEKCSMLANERIELSNALEQFQQITLQNHNQNSQIEAVYLNNNNYIFILFV